MLVSSEGDECIKKPSKKTNHLYEYNCDGGALTGGFSNGVGRRLWPGTN